MVLWSEKTFAHLQEAQPETLTSQMKVDHSLVLNILQRPGDAVAAGFQLLTDNHEPPKDPNPLIERAKEIIESLAMAGVLVVHDADWQAAHAGESAVEFAREVPEDFALNSPLAPFALAALEILDKESEDYALDVVSVMESVQEDPKPLLYAQQRTIPDGAERDALFHEAKRLFAAYAPYKFLGHRIETAVYHTWVIGFRRHPFMRDFWKYVDIDPDRKTTST